MLSARLDVRPQSLSRSLEHATAESASHFAMPLQTCGTYNKEASDGAFTRKGTSAVMTQWVDDVLKSGGVLVALPASVWAENDKRTKTPSGRVGQLRMQTPIGKSEWWQKHLHKSTTQDKLSYRLDEETNVYHMQGLEDSNSWFPEAADYEMSMLSLEWDRISLAGFTTSIQNITYKGDEFSMANVPMLMQRILLEIETAANGISPALFATCLVKKGGGVSARLSVTQLHSFRLSDMLRSYNEMLGDPLRRPSLGALDSTLYELTAAIARKVRGLADMRFLKMNMTADTIVMCPVLAGDTESALEEQGYGFEGMQTVKGMPYMIDFDVMHTRRVSPSQTEYDADCAYVVMMMVLLASVKAQYGQVYRVMANKLIGRSIAGAELPEGDLPENFGEIDLMYSARRTRAAGKVSAFCSLMRTVLPSMGKKHNAELSAAYAEVAADFADVVREEVFDPLWTSKKPVPFDRSRPLFSQLVQYLSASTQVDTAIFKEGPSNADVIAHHERVSKVEQRLNAVKFR